MLIIWYCESIIELQGFHLTISKWIKTQDIVKKMKGHDWLLYLSVWFQGHCGYVSLMSVADEGWWTGGNYRRRQQKAKQSTWASVSWGP